MTKDYAKPSTTRKKGSASKRKPSSGSSKKASTKKPATQSKKTRKEPSKSSPGQAKYIVLILLVLGGFGYTLYELAKVPHADGPANSEIQNIQKKPSSKAAIKKETIAPAPEARFQFYDLLPNSEVETDTVDAYTFKEKGKSEQYRYIVQTGSFRSQKDAERQRATIAFQGLKGRVRKVANDSGSVWYRVETGPFESRSEMNAALDKLVAINIQPLVKKQKK